MVSYNGFQWWKVSLQGKENDHNIQKNLSNVLQQSPLLCCSSVSSVCSKHLQFAKTFLKHSFSLCQFRRSLTLKRKRKKNLQNFSLVCVYQYNFVKNILYVLKFNILLVIHTLVQLHNVMSVYVRQRERERERERDGECFWEGSFRTSQGHHSCTQEPWAAIFGLIFGHRHIIQKSCSCVCYVCSNLCTVFFKHSCVYWVCVWCVIFTYAHVCVYKYYFALFIFVIPCCAFLPRHLSTGCFFLLVVFFFSSLWFSTSRSRERERERKGGRERENNFAILRETFSLPSSGNDVMSEDLQKTRQICYSKTFSLKYQCPLAWTDLVAGLTRYNPGRDKALDNIDKHQRIHLISPKAHFVQI